MPKKENKKVEKDFKKEANDDIQKALKKVKEQRSKKPKKSKKELTTESALKEEIKKIEKEKKRIKKMNSEEFAEWLIDKHQNYTSTMRYLLSGNDFLNDEDDESRFYLLTYMNELCSMLSTYEINFMGKEISDILYSKNEVELLAILNVLNYIN